MSEQWIQWKPISNIDEKYDIDSVVDTLSTFEIVLSSTINKEKRIKVVFKNSVDIYKFTYIKFKQKTLEQLYKKYGRTFFDWTFFKATNSSLLQWVSEESCTISDSRELQHFAFIDGNSMVDIINGSEPKVEMLK